MIKGIINTYIEAKYSFIQKMSQSEENSFHETEFLDDGTIQYRIKSLKEEFKVISQDIQMIVKYDKNDNYHEKRIEELIKRKDQVSFNIAFLASNSLNSLEICEEVLKGLNSDFNFCILALKYYKNGEEQRAFEIFYAYFKDKSKILDHYLINKVYGLLLYKNKEYRTALILLRKAVEKRPEDIEIHKILRSIYSIMNMNHEEKIEQSILEVLEV